MKTILLLTLISSSLFAQEVYWQSLIKVEHPITGARDSTWFGIGNVAEGYNPYLDSLFYGNYDSLQDIRILGFDNLAYDSGVYYSHLPSICADLHRNIRPLNYYNHTLNYVKFHFLIWVDESNFQEEQYAQLILPGNALQELLTQNVPHWGFESDSAYLFEFLYGVNTFDGAHDQEQFEVLIDQETLSHPEDTLADLKFDLNEPLCPLSYSVKVYHLRIFINFYFDLVGISSFSKTNAPAYPNPTSGWLYGLGFDQKQLYNTQGQCLDTFQNEQWDISHYPPGMYYLYQKNRMQSIVKY